MEWASGTADEVRKMTKGQLCILPLGCVEPHGHHLPTGNDGLIAHRWASMAAEQEPVMVLPPLFYGYAKPGRHLPGTISLDTQVMLALLENICDEVCRNGYTKILILNCHGGNNAILEVLLQHVSDKAKGYALYVPPPFLMEDIVNEIKETSEWGHACEIETSISLHLFPDLCRMDRVPKGFFSSRKPYDVGPAKTQIDWYASYPDAYIGDARKASAEKGKRLTEVQVQRLVDMIRKIKKDKMVMARIREYGRKS